MMISIFATLNKKIPMMLANQIKQRAQSIKLMVFDVDGVLTDGTLVYGANGEEVKHFNVKDGVGLKLLQTYGVEVAIISAKDSKPLAKRISDLGISHAYTGCKDKLAALSELMGKLDVTFDEVAYCGDDVIDLKVMQKAGLSIAPSDAYFMVKEYAHYVTQVSGGKGVAREVADVILSGRMDLKDAYIKAMLPEFEEQDFQKKL
jgi:3-deoxy-D-manno-octulosonate 8-phosphate phosphatase (KDO 8-P phosphatase)